ncbi:fumble-domain-containing protein [Pelagophyceae sp. CCMP2097]|nr:fumble-domain-containing protein [Pelagophyceae sp. CCMP2097]
MSSGLFSGGARVVLGRLPPAPLRVALDIGGSTIKGLRSDGAVFRASTDEIERVVDALRGERVDAVTGGGALRYGALLAHFAGAETVDEMEAAVAGVQALRAEGLLVDAKGRPVAEEATAGHPIVVCSIGSGTSVLVVSADGAHRRVTGTCFGAGTFAGLGFALTGERDAGALAGLASKVSSAVDLTVGDIYGAEASAKLGLPPDILAASFAKAPRLDAVEPADAASSLAVLTGWTIGQLATWVAKAEAARHVVFVGGVDGCLRDRLDFPVGFESQGAIASLFPETEASPFVGAFGALVVAQRRSAEGVPL